MRCPICRGTGLIDNPGAGNYGAPPLVCPTCGGTGKIDTKLTGSTMKLFTFRECDDSISVSVTGTSDPASEQELNDLLTVFNLPLFNRNIAEGVERVRLAREDNKT